MTEHFKFVTYENDPDWIYLDNLSPMFLCETKKWFIEILGAENIAIYQLGGFFGGLCNSFKFKKSCYPLFQEKIKPELVKNEDGIWQRANSLAEANQI